MNSSWVRPYCGSWLCHTSVQDRADSERSKTSPILQGGEHLVERAGPHEFALFQEDDAICKLKNFADCMADIDHRDAQFLMKPAYERENLLLPLNIERGKRFIQ